MATDNDETNLQLSRRKLLAAAAVQGAVFRVVKEASDHYARRGFANVTGSWPGEQRPDPE